MNKLVVKDILALLPALILVVAVLVFPQDIPSEYLVADISATSLLAIAYKYWVWILAVLIAAIVFYIGYIVYNFKNKK